MQEIKYDGSLGEKKEGTIKELLELADESLAKEDVAAVVISKGDQDPEKQIVIHTIPGRKNKSSGMGEDKIRHFIRDELKIMLEKRDPFFQKILKEIQDD